VTPAFWRGFWHGLGWPIGIFMPWWRKEWVRIYRAAPPANEGDIK